MTSRMITGKFVIATDGSDAALRAEEMATDLASAVGIGIDVLCVAQIPQGSHFASSASALGLETEQAEEVLEWNLELREAVRRVRERLEDKSLPVKGFLLEHASPARAIIEFCATSTVPVAAIFIGNRGKGGFPRLLMGSVSDQVVKGAGCPVVVVKAVSASAETGGGEPNGRQNNCHSGLEGQGAADI